MTMRVNTLWCEYAQRLENSEKPTLKENFKWIFETLKNKIVDLESKLLGIQTEPNGFYLKFDENNICQDILEKFSDGSKIKKENGAVVPITISSASIGQRRIRVLRFPFEVTNENIKLELSKYGKIISIEDEYWSQDYAQTSFKYKTGNRIVMCILEKHIPSFIVVKGSRGMITYDNQPKTCSYCSGDDHLISTCSKLLQKTSKATYSEALSGASLPQDPVHSELSNIDTPNDSTLIQSLVTEPSSQPEIHTLLAPQQTLEQNPTLELSDTTYPSLGNKRDHCSSSSDSTVSSKKQKQKGLKKNQELTNFEQPIKKLYSTCDIMKSLPHLSPENCNSLLNELQFSKKPLPILKKFKIEPPVMLDILSWLHQLENMERSAKIRLTKITNEITHHLEVFYLLEPEETADDEASEEGTKEAA